MSLFRRIELTERASDSADGRGSEREARERETAADAEWRKERMRDKFFVSNLSSVHRFTKYIHSLSLYSDSSHSSASPRISLGRKIQTFLLNQLSPIHPSTPLVHTRQRSQRFTPALTLAPDVADFESVQQRGESWEKKGKNPFRSWLVLRR